MRAAAPSGGVGQRWQGHGYRERSAVNPLAFGFAERDSECGEPAAHPDCLGPIGKLAQALGGPPRVGFTCDDWSGKQALVAGGVGITVMPTLTAPAVRADIALCATTPALPRRRVFAAVAPREHRTAAASAMLTLLRELAARP